MPIKLSSQDFKELSRQGYTGAEINQAMKEIEREELENSFSYNMHSQQDPRMQSQMSSFSSKQDDNIIRWQLDLNDILERAEHILRGDIPKFENGQVIWKSNPHPEKNPLNEIGVQEVMKILAMYVNRNTILSDYTNREINFKVYDFGRAVNNLIFMRDLELGLDTEEKRKNYEMLVTEIKDIVHSAYKRALEGAEKRSLREMIQITQSNATTSQVSNGTPMGVNGMPMAQRGLLNPMRIIKGKYV